MADPENEVRAFPSIPRVDPRRLLDAGWGWFDSLNSLQTACLLTGVTFLLVLMALLLHAASGSLVASGPPGRTLATAPARVAEAPRPGSAEGPRLQLAVGDDPALGSAVTLVPGLRLREHPSTSASVLATLPVATRLEILDQRISPQESEWARVRTADGTVGWVVVTAIE